MKVGVSILREMKEDTSWTPAARRKMNTKSLSNTSSLTGMVKEQKPPTPYDAKSLKNREFHVYWNC